MPPSPRPDAAPDLTCDVAVIGAGSAGISAERAARRQGARTLLIDPEFRGTLCASTGCMPSKLLIAAAHAAHDARRAPVFGVHPGPVRIDGAAVMARVRAERDRFAALTRQGFDDLPQGTAIRARARFAGPGRLVLDDGRTVGARAIIIATGSVAMVPKPFRDPGAAVLTNETVFELPDLPTRLAVIGGGPIGLELAQAMARLGVPVTLFDREDRLGKVRCDVVHDALRAAIARDVTLVQGVDATPQAVTGGIRMSWDGTFEDFSHVLVATGRPPALDGLDLDAAGLTLDDHGTPVFDRTTMQCGDHPVFIAGDADADAPLLHEASTEGAIAGHNAATWPRVTPGLRSPLFAITFTDPPLAAIGQDPDGATICGRSDYSDQGRARTEARAEGAVTLYADAKGRLIGADLCCPGADHLAHLLAWSVQSGATAAGLLALPFYHPTLEEGLRTALRDICRQTRQPEPHGRDFGHPPGA